MEFAGLPNRTQQLSIDLNPTSSIAVPQNYLSESWRSLYNRSALVVIDPTVPDYQQLIAGIQPDANVLILDPAKDEIAQITQALLGQSGISSLHLVSHGESGAIRLGGTWLDRASLDRYQSEFQLWAKSLTDEADILIYGCDVAQGEAGRSFIQQFSQLTGADIAASDDLTGSVTLNGDWTFEANTGEIAASIAFNPETLARYTAILPVDLISVGNPSVSQGSVGIENIGRNSVSGDGRYVVFTSSAVLSPNDANGTSDVFLYDRQTDALTLISRTESGSASGLSFNPVISYDGNSVAFVSNANDLVTETANNTTQTNNVYVWERSDNQVTLVSRKAIGGSGEDESIAPSISDDGSVIAFQSSAQLLATDTNFLLDVYVWSRSRGLTHVSQTTGGRVRSGGADSPVVSGDGNYVAFSSLYSTLVDGDVNRAQDVFVWQRSGGALVNLTINGRDGESFAPTISQDGRRVAFSSSATGLTATDTNGAADVFVWTRDTAASTLTGSLQLVSVNRTGDNTGSSVDGFGNNVGSQNAVISRNGAAIAFTSSSTDLVSGDTNSKVDVFLRNLATNQTVLVSRDTAGAIADDISGTPGISADGTRVVFTSAATNLVSGDTNAQTDVFVRDFSTGQTILVSRSATGGVGNNISGIVPRGVAASLSVPVISGDGSVVAFASLATNLTENDANALFDGFIIPTTTGNATLMSRRSSDQNLVSRTGSGDSSIAASSLSENGRFIVFTSAAAEIVEGDTNNVADVFLRDRQTGITTLISRGAAIANGASGNASISADGRYVVFTSAATNLVNGDANGAIDIFWVDRQTSQVRLVSRAGAGSGNGASENPVMSADGLFVAFTSMASDLGTGDANGQQDVFLWNSQTNAIVQVGANGDGASEQPVISSDGRYVAFVSAASNLVAGDTNAQKDVFVWDRTTGTIALVSRSTGANGAISDGSSTQVSMSQNGRVIAFTSTARNLTGTPDNDSDEDVFVRNLDTNTTIHVSANASGGYTASSEFSPLRAFSPVVSGNGNYVVFTSNFGDLVAIDTNDTNDVFRRDLTTNQLQLISVNQADNDSGNNAPGSDGGTGGGSGTGSFYPVLSNDGRYVVFNSFSTNLAENDTNSAIDVFVRDVVSGITTLISRIPAETNSGRGASFNPVISGNGGYIAFNSLATDLVPRDLNGKSDVFGFNLATTVSLLQEKETVLEKTPADTVRYTIRRNQTTGELTVKLNLDATSTATIDTDYTLTADPSLNLTRNGSEVTIRLANGVNEGVLTLTAIDDIAIEGAEVVNLSLVATNDYAVSESFATAAVNITDNDVPVLVGVTNVTTNTREGDRDFRFEVKLQTPATTAPVTIEYTTQAGTATDADFTPTTGTLTFNPGESDTQFVTVRIKEDALIEPDETFTLVLRNPSANASIAQNGTATATIVDDDAARTVTITGAETITEGDSGTQNIVYTVSLSEASANDVTVDYALNDVTTTSGTDYVAVPNGTLRFSAGETQKTITVTVNGDRAFEGDEQFSIALSNAVGAVIPQAQQLKTVTITDDDPAPEIRIAAVDTLTEGNTGTQNYTFTVSLTETSTQEIRVNYAIEDITTTSGTDYVTLPNGLLTFAPGETSKTITVQINGDRTFEGDEQFRVVLSNPVMAILPTAQRVKVATIQNDDTAPTFTISADPSQSEATSPYRFTVALSAVSGLETTVNYTTIAGTATDGSDFTATSGSLTFAPAETSKTIDIAVLNDSRREPNETFLVQLTDPANAATILGTATATIANDDPIPTVSITNVSQVEGNSGTTSLEFTVTLSNASDDPITLNYATEDGTATIADGDYQAATGQLTFAAGQTTRTFTVNAVGDTKREQTETFSVRLSSPNANVTVPGDAIGVGTITTDDTTLPTLSISPTTATEGGALTFTVTLSELSSDEIRVNFATSDGSATSGTDYTATTGTLIFAPNDRTKTITVQTIDDTRFEGDETVSLTLTSATNATLLTATATGTLTDNDTAPTLTINSTPLTENSPQSATYPFVVRLSNPTNQTVTVRYRTVDDTATVADSDYVAAEGTVTFNPGETEKAIAIQANGDTKFEPNERFIVRLDTPVNATLATTPTESFGTLNNDDAAPTITIADPAPVAEGNTGTTAIRFAVRLSNPSSDPITVQYVTRSGNATETDYTPITTPTTLTFAPGQTEQFITIQAIGDTTLETDETFTLELSNPTNAQITRAIATATIQNDDAPPRLSVVAVPTTKPEGNSGITPFTFEVTLNGATSLPVTVNFSTADGTATIANNDYVRTADTLTFAPGETRKTITVNVLGDGRFENDETFQLVLSTPTNATIETATATVTIAEDDTAPSDTNDTLYDILWRNRRTGENMLWQPNATLLERESPLFNIADPRWRIVATADFTGDDITDLLWRNSTTGQNVIWRMAPDLTFQSAFILPVLGSWEIEGTGDFNRDRRIDLLWRNTQTGENAIWFLRDTTFESSSNLLRIPDTSWEIEQVADFNNDGNADIFWSNRRTGDTSIWLMDGANIRNSVSLLPVPDLAWRVAAAGDFNGDGFVDLLWRNSQTGNNAIWMLRNGQFDRSVAITPVSTNGWQIERVFDFDGDRNLDILWRNGGTQEMVLWFMNRELLGTYVSLPNTLDRNWSIEGVGKFGNQNRAEIVLRNYQTGENRVWRISPNTFNRVSTLDSLPDRDWEVQGTADFDRDGNADILWRNLRTREMTIWTTQNGQVQNKIPVPIGLAVPTGWKIEGIGDFSGDGSPDLIWQNQNTSEVVMWLFDGTQYSSGFQVFPATGLQWKISAIGDFNGDRNLDILWRNFNTGELSYWLFDRTRLDRSVITSAVNLDWQISAIGDFNRDGQMDLVWRNERTAVSTIWLMNGTQMNRSITLPTASLDWKIAGVGEYNQDGQLDLLWRNSLTGSNVVWYLNNGNFSLDMFISALPDVDWRVEDINDF